ncbi:MULTISPECIES: glucosaminidase domain-containing protein [unclassified Treponema]|uniref:glucosaminidase domain-containing protein n=1 Tax=unclassified Treponema TaxID=2638727 RepID=UPI00068D54A9|nr:MULTISPECIES: glucosaminidase domain-containing protein [unclassified Treponema]UTC49781.1 glucosaminidase domain-containing protein [Treponema sp. OMZ 855]
MNIKTLHIKRLFLFLALISLFLCFSCRSVPPSIPKAIMGTGRMTQEQLVSFFLMQTALAQTEEVDQEKVERLAGYYVKESSAEGINADIAFAQMCLETGFLQFGGLVTADMNNFCGLGAINAENPGLVFPDEQTGVRAHIQHLKAYASAEPLKLPSVDPRYRYVNPKGKAPHIYNLAGTWASDPAYGHKIDQLLRRMYAGL